MCRHRIRTFATDMFFLYHVTLEEPSQNGNLGTRYVYICVDAECGRGRVGGRKAAYNTSIKALANQ